MLKVMIIGCPGAGKSRFARKLRDKTGLPLYHLDMIWHKPDRTTISKEEFDIKLAEIVQKDRWIIDGNYQRTLEIRLRECDTVFLMDYPLDVCLAGAESRIGRKREDLPWLETEFDEEFKQWIISFPQNELPGIYELVNKYKDEKNIVIFKSREETDDYLRKFSHMKNDNTTPMTAEEYDNKINDTIPYYSEFYKQTLDVVEQCAFGTINWLDLGCGTGSLEEQAFERFTDISFTLADPSKKMLEKAAEKLKDRSVQYICAGSDTIDFENRFDVVTAIQSHHYMHKEERKKATKGVYRALKEGGIYICFENVVPEDEDIKRFELRRWGRYQERHGKTKEEAAAHNARCGKNYFPLTVAQHKKLLKQAGFKKVHVFWCSYMQMGIYGIK